MSNILIDANNISKIYDPDIYLKRGKNVYALKNVNFVLEKGDFTCIMGPSGSGKSTLLNCLSTLDYVTSGHILLKGVDMTALHKSQLCQFRYETLGFVFQNHNLIPYLSIFDNIATPAMLGNMNTKTLQNKVLSLAKELEIEKILDKFPYECSGGECQRVAIARALINDPEIIVCDEPTGNLDSKNSHKVLNILSKLNQQGKTILLVTHDAMIASYAKTMIYLYDGQIKTVIHRHQGKQIDFYKKIHEIVSQDSLLKEFTQEPWEKQDNVYQESLQDKNNTQKIEKDISFLSRQKVYMYLKGQIYDEELINKYTPLCIEGTTITYMNKYNDAVTFDLSDIHEITLDLSSRFLNFGFFSQFVFNICVDMTSHLGTYQFKAMNKDDFIYIIQHFQKLGIPIVDSRDILGTYIKYPKDYERQKFYQRTHKDLTAYKG